MPHLAPKKYRANFDFSSIGLEGDFEYCKSHNFVYDSIEEERKLYNAEPCIYTDIRYDIDGLNFYKKAYLYMNRSKPLSLKACIRRVLRCRNIPTGTSVYFGKEYYYPKKKFDVGFEFKVKKENKFEPEYQINASCFFNSFKTHSNELVERMREEGFLVQIWNSNPGFIYGDNDGEIAIAHGYGKIIGFSTGSETFRGYQNGCENILWDRFQEFDKWSRCEEIPKNTPIDEIIKQLKEIK